MTAKSIDGFLKNYVLKNGDSPSKSSSTKIEYVSLNGKKIPQYINEFWTSKQRQAKSIHEISYRACFKPQLPHFFIELLTKEKDVVYDPFNGRGTTIIEAALMRRNIIANDINPLSIILSKPRLFIPDIGELSKRLSSIKISKGVKPDIDLSMFYHPKTLSEIVSLRNYLIKRKKAHAEDELDMWIRMVATNRLTGHSRGFFSVYTLPPNQAVSQSSQIKINKSRKQKPVYRDTKEIMLTKSRDLIKNIVPEDISNLNAVSNKALFLVKDARYTGEIRSNSVQLTVTSPPFLDIVQYADDNWLRCWFNDIDAASVSGKITMSKKLDDWCNIMSDVFKQLYRITKRNGFVAFEVGEVRNGKIRLDEYIAEIGMNAGFNCIGIMINRQIFTKTSNIWGIQNNKHGTNSNRIVIFKKER